MRIGDFSNNKSIRYLSETEKRATESKKELEAAKLALHREFLRVDTLLRNIPDIK